MSKSRLVLEIDTDLPIGTMKDILDNEPASSSNHVFLQKLINFLRGLNSGARSGNVYAGVVDSGLYDANVASNTGSFTGTPNPNDTVTINGVVITFVSSASPSNNQVSLSGSPSTSVLASRLAAAINSSTTDSLAGVVSAASSTNFVIVDALIAGVMGNSISLASSAANFSWGGSASFLSGGLGRLPVLNAYPYYRKSNNGASVPLGPLAVNLATAAPFAMLTESGITDSPPSPTIGNVGASPITGAAIGITQAEVTGTIYAVDGAGPAGSVDDPTLLTQAVSDMQAAYTDAAGRPSPNFTNLGGGAIGGLSLQPGLYKWTTGVTIASNVTLNGGPNDVYIFQISGVLSEAVSASVLLAGGLQAKNIFWAVNSCALSASAHMEGNVLSAAGITLGANASVHGRLLAQTAVTLITNTVTIAN